MIRIKVLGTPSKVEKVGIVSLGPISQRDVSPDLDLNLRLCQQNVKSVVLDLADFTKQLSP